MPRVIEALVTGVVLLVFIFALYRVFRWVIGVNELKELRKEKIRLTTKDSERTALLLQIYQKAHDAQVVSDPPLASELMKLIKAKEPMIAHHAEWVGGDFVHPGEAEEGH